MIKSILLSVLALSSTALAAPTDPSLKRDDGGLCAYIGGYAPVADVIECVNELQARGGDACELIDATSFCRHNDAVIAGVNAKLDGQTKSTSCADIANSVLQVVDGCTLSSQYVGGHLPALGNADITVNVGHVMSMPGK